MPRRGAGSERAAKRKRVSYSERVEIDGLSSLADSQRTESSGYQPSEVDSSDRGEPSQPTVDVGRLSLRPPAERAAQTPAAAGAPTAPVSNRAPAVLHRAPSSVGGSPRSKVHGGNIVTGDSAWNRFIGKKLALVDKSLAILDVMECDSTVIAGLYPRRMGKSTFLDLLRNFLAVVSETSFPKRWERFSQYEINEKEPEFFREHFARYPVFKLTMKTQDPTSIDDAACQLHVAVQDAALYHVRFLRKLTSGGAGVDLGPYDDDDIKEKAHSNRDIIDDAIKMFDRVMDRGNIGAGDIAHISAVIPSLMDAFFHLLGRGAVVLVDEYDAPFLNVNKNAKLTSATKDEIKAIYTRFLGTILKDSSFLDRGVLVGVFDANCLGLGSGLNHAVVHLAHSGMADEPNPFQHAFGFTAPEVWGVVNHYVDRQWPGRATCPDAEAFKRQLMTGFVVHFDGYRIGSVPHVFNPQAVLRFLLDLHDKTPATTRFGGRRDWVDTGCLWLVTAVQLASMDVFDRYFERLVEVYFEQRVDAVAGGPVAVVESTTSLDEAVGLLGAEEQSQPLAESATAVDEDLAEICMGSRAKDLIDLRTLGEEPISARTAVWLLYQAGYIAPAATAGRMAVPNAEVLRELVRYHQTVADLHTRRSDPLRCAHEAIGIRDGNPVRFVESLHAALVRSPGLSRQLAELNYQQIVAALLNPVTYIGFDVRCEDPAESGWADVVVSPGAGQGAAAFYVFELKRQPRGGDYNELMALDSRRAAEDAARDLALRGEMQARDRYWQAAMVKARGCRRLFRVSVAFWMHRMYAVVKRYQCQEPRGWASEPFADADIRDVPPESMAAAIDGGGDIHISTIVSAAEQGG